MQNVSTQQNISCYCLVHDLQDNRIDIAVSRTGRVTTFQITREKLPTLEILNEDGKLQTYESLKTFLDTLKVKNTPEEDIQPLSNLVKKKQI